MVLTESPLHGARRIAVTSRDEPFRIDEASFRELHDRIARPLWAYLAKTSGDPALADDLLQESFFRFLRTGFRPESGAHARNYLYRIATNLLRDRYRRKRFTEVPLEHDPGEPSKTYSTDTRRDLERMLARLRPRDRRLLWLAHVEGLRHREIAAVLEIKEASVRLLLFRARRKLAEEMRRHGLAPEETS